MELALWGVCFFLIGVLWGYALFHKPFKFEIHLHKKPNLPPLPKAYSIPKVSANHENKVDEVIKQAKTHFKNLQKGNA